MIMNNTNTRFMEEKWKVNRDKFKYPAPLFGYALCCNTKPLVDFDINSPNHQIGHIACPVCNNQIGVIAGGKEKALRFLYNNWNRNFPNGPFEMPEGFQWGEIILNYVYMGGEKEVRSCFGVIKIEDKTVYNYCLYRKEIVKFEMPKNWNLDQYEIKGRLSYNLTVSNGVWFNPRQEYKIFRFYAFNYKWAKKLEQFLHLNITQYES